MRVKGSQRAGYVAGLPRPAVAYLFVLPALAVVLGYVIYPSAATVLWSFYSWKPMSAAKQWVGIGNYAGLAADPVFWKCLKNNGLWIGLSLVIQLPVALGLAVALNSLSPIRRFVRAAFFAPFVLPVVAVGLIWWLIFDPTYGALNAALTWLARLIRPGAGAVHLPWLGDPSIATLCLIAVATWRYLGFHTMVILAGLQSIPQEYYDAALVDGATGWQVFRYVTLPLLQRVLLVDALLIAVGSVKIFDLIWVMTRGDPHGSTHVLATYMYYCGFTIDRMGYACALAVVMLVLTSAATAVYLRITGREEILE